MTVTAHNYTKAVDAMRAGSLDLSTGTFKVMLLASYTPAVDTHEFLSDVLAAGTEAVGTGYTTGGQTLTTPSWSASSHTWKFTCASITAWNATSGSLAGAYLVFYKSTGTNSTSAVFVYWDLGGTQTASLANFTVTPDATGIYTFVSTG